MTKKDYELLAGVIRATMEEFANVPTCSAISVLAERLAKVLKIDNPRFDRARFLAACHGEDSTDSAGRKVRYSNAS